MDLFAFVGVSNAEILTVAAAVFAGAAAGSVMMRVLKAPAREAREPRADRAELRLAAKQSYAPVLMAAEALVASAQPISEEPVAEIFEAAMPQRSWFSKRTDPAEVGSTVLSDAKANIEIAADMARPVANMFDNGSIEVARERRNVAKEMRTQAGFLKTAAWDRHAEALLRSGVPTRPTALMQAVFGQTHELKAASDRAARTGSVDDLMEVLRLSASLLAAADDLFTELRHQSGGQKLLPPPTCAQDEAEDAAAAAEEGALQPA